MANDSSEVGINVCFGYVMENGGQNDSNINDRFIRVYRVVLHHGFRPHCQCVSQFTRIAFIGKRTSYFTHVTLALKQPIVPKIPFRTQWRWCSATLHVHPRRNHHHLPSTSGQGIRQFNDSFRGLWVLWTPQILCEGARYIDQNALVYQISS